MNPLALVVAATVPALALLISVDPVTPTVVLEPGAGVVADGPPAAVFRERGADLAARGVWVPGREPSSARRPRRST